tara:strand:- start:1123 stop:1350 length:228 start_codon:yes stop_codon:yes gene_type:complete
MKNTILKMTICIALLVGLVYQSNAQIGDEVRYKGKIYIVVYEASNHTTLQDVKGNTIIVNYLADNFEELERSKIN